MNGQSKSLGTSRSITGRPAASETTARRSVIIGGLSVGTTVLTGCTGLFDEDADPPPVEALDANIIDARAPSAGLTSATIPIILEMINTHTEDEIPSATVDYDAFVNDTQVASARKDIASLGPGDTAREEFEIVAEYADIGSGIVSAIRNSSFTVRIEGSVESEGASTTFESKYEL